MHNLPAALCMFSHAGLPSCCRTSGAVSASGAMLATGSSAWRRPCPPRTGAWTTTGSATARPSAPTCTFMVSEPPSSFTLWLGHPSEEGEGGRSKGPGTHHCSLVWFSQSPFPLYVIQGRMSLHPSSAPTLGWLCHLHSDRGPGWETARFQCCADAPGTCYFADKTMGVFHLQSPRKKYDFTYEQAQRACAAEGASLATFRQLSAAQQVSGVGARCPFACWCFLNLQRKKSWGQQWAALPKAFAFGKKKAAFW